jgi:hypothetical protein
VAQVVQRQCAHSGLLEDDLDDLETWCRNDLVPAIDLAVASEYYPQEELSELLANAGVLPMFGFPTRVRALYGRKPGSRSALDQAVVTDRPLNMAVSAFSPGARVVRDGRTHTSVGFAAWDVRGPKLYPKDPLGPSIQLRRCEGCGVVQLESMAEELCPVCQVNKLEPLKLYQPLGFIIFLIAAVAETNRAPFDLPEAETELISGFHTEYSGFRFSFYFLAEYISMIVISLFAATIFLGGTDGPIREGVWWLALKASIFLFFYIWLRTTVPRFRYDQLMGLAWKVLLPLVLLNILITGLIRLWGLGAI